MFADTTQRGYRSESGTTPIFSYGYPLCMMSAPQRYNHFSNLQSVFEKKNLKSEKSSSLSAEELNK